MTYIEYAAVCHKGLIRDKNQDNLWCDNMYLNAVNEGLPEILTGTLDAISLPVFAVFDGMGGEQQGEIAAFLAANSFNILLQENDRSEAKKFLFNACTEMNKKITLYQTENHINNMGTTTAILLCGTDAIYVCNVGDSRIYQYSSKKLSQISIDHVGICMNNRKAPLTQNLGIPEEEFIIEPYIAKGAYKSSAQYLICSDGLTDMVDDKQVTEIFKKTKNPLETAESLMGLALSNGGADNVTLIVCKIHKKRFHFIRK